MSHFNTIDYYFSWIESFLLLELKGSDLRNPILNTLLLELKIHQVELENQISFHPPNKKLTAKKTQYGKKFPKKDLNELSEIINIDRIQNMISTSFVLFSFIFSIIFSQLYSYVY